MTTRRNFLSAVALGGAALSTSAMAASAQAPKSWDKTVNVLVIGTGFAGLAAALEAVSQGEKNLLLIEKMPYPGGNSAINGGDLTAAGTDMQEKMGIKDSADLLYQDMLRAGGYLNHPKLARKVADESVDNFKWCRDFVGVKFGRVNYHGGHSVKRAHQTVELSGAGIIMPMLKKLESLGIKPQLRTKVLEFYEKDNTVIGVKVLENYQFGKEDSGTVKNYRVKKGVIIASGGFSNGVKMRQLHDPRLDERFTSTNQPGTTGECLQAAQMLGAADVQMDWIQLGPWTSPDEEGFGFVPQFCERVIGYGLMVDPATGKRFFKETGNRKERADAIIKVGHPVLILADSVNTNKMVAKKTLDGAMGNGSIKAFDTPEAIADYYKMPKEAFLEQFNRWNGFVKAHLEKDPDLDCMIFKDAVPNVTPPYYVARLWPRVHHTMGGLAITPNAEVLNAKLEPIGHLYAAGEVTGGVHGMVRLGSVAGADCITFGREAGRQAAKQTPR